MAARAGVVSSKPDPDFGIDLCLRALRHEGNVYQDSGVQLDVQLRCTTRAILTDVAVLFDLGVRTYEYLRRPAPLCPRILVVLVLPEEEPQWFSQSPEELILRRCACWISLRNAEPMTATSSIRITIPRAQVFSPEALQALLDRIDRGEEP